MTCTAGARRQRLRHQLVAWRMYSVSAMLSKERVYNNIMSPLGYVSNHKWISKNFFMTRRFCLLFVDYIVVLCYKFDSFNCKEIF